MASPGTNRCVHISQTPCELVNEHGIIRVAHSSAPLDTSGTGSIDSALLAPQAPKLPETGFASTVTTCAPTTQPASRKPSKHIGWTATFYPMAKCDFCELAGRPELQKCDECKISICRACYEDGKLNPNSLHHIDEALVWTRARELPAGENSRKNIRARKPKRASGTARGSGRPHISRIGNKGAIQKTNTQVPRTGSRSQNARRMSRFSPSETPSTPSYAGTPELLPMSMDNDNHGRPWIVDTSDDNDYPPCPEAVMGFGENYDDSSAKAAKALELMKVGPPASMLDQMLPLPPARQHIVGVDHPSHLPDHPQHQDASSSDWKLPPVRALLDVCRDNGHPPTASPHPTLAPPSNEQYSSHGERHAYSRGFSKDHPSASPAIAPESCPSGLATLHSPRTRNGEHRFPQVAARQRHQQYQPETRPPAPYGDHVLSHVPGSHDYTLDKYPLPRDSSPVQRYADQDQRSLSPAETCQSQHGDYDPHVTGCWDQTRHYEYPQPPTPTYHHQSTRHPNISAVESSHSSDGLILLGRELWEDTVRMYNAYPNFTPQDCLFQVVESRWHHEIPHQMIGVRDDGAALELLRAAIDYVCDGLRLGRPKMTYEWLRLKQGTIRHDR
ncbi:hypothetical protein B0I35DRAFT_475344 [Stachybotrys elegans]|uniref:ZZ-type domain-containing protein n=1 Tax=Stachybotrys elegans TaxID=80388 RepID=A0A8K0T2H4_9HYPO|nr:hypothetical protein B0I35DRAFT_475344 [Stachybotrys elegans]